MDPRVHYRVYKFPPPAPILSQISPVHTPTSHFLTIHVLGLKGLFNVRSAECKTSTALDCIEMCTAETG